MKQAVLLQKYAFWLLQKCDKAGLTTRLFGPNMAGSTLRPERAETILYHLWVRLDSHPIVPYTAFPKEALVAPKRNVRSYITRN